MKNILQNLCYLLVFTFVLSSCSKEGVAPADVSLDEAKIAQDYLLKSPTIVLLADLEINHETNRVNGFLIDKKGEVKTLFNVANHGINLEEGHISDRSLRNLHDKGVKDYKHNLTVIEIADYVKKTNTLKKNGGLANTNDQAATTRVQLNFKRNIAHNLSPSCGPGVYDHGPTHHQVVITARGQYDYENSASVGLEISAWLNEIKEEAKAN